MRVVLKSPKEEIKKSYGNATKQMKLGTHETNDKEAHNKNNTNNNTNHSNTLSTKQTKEL